MNKKYIIGIMMSITVGLASIIFINLIDKIEYENTKIVDIRELVYNEKFEERNAFFNTEQKATIKFDSREDGYYYYVIMEFVNEPAFLVYMDENQYQKILDKDDYSFEYKGVAKKLTIEEKEKIIEECNKGFDMNLSLDNFEQHFYNLYLNAGAKNEKSTILPTILVIVILGIGMIGVIFNMVMLIKNNMEKKIKLTKVIFVVSFIPYIALLGIALFNAMIGFDFFFSTTYGFEAFMGTIVIYGIMVSVYFPVLPIVLLYQVIYIIINIIKNKKNKIKRN